MEDNHEVLTMERLHDLISEACECISIANNETKVKLRKIIQNEAFECLNEEPSDLIKAIDILWSEQPEDVVVIKTINEWKLEGIKVIEDENLVIKIMDKENICNVTRSLFPSRTYDYIVEVSVKGFTTTLSKDFSMVECINPLVWSEGHEGRADYTIGEGIINYGKMIYSLAEKFCLINMVGLEVTEKLLKVAKVNYQLTLIIIENCTKRIVESSNYVEIVDSFKSQYEEELKVKPRVKGFRDYLDNVLEIHNLHLDDVLMEHLADHVVSERVKNFSFIQEAKDKQQKVIDITPHQTLSIEATSATVEESKEVEIIIKDEVNGTPCIEFDKLFGTDIKWKNEVWRYMLDLKMIDANGAFKMGSSRSFILSFIKVMKKYFKLPNQRDTPLVRIFTLKLLGKSRRINESEKIDEEHIEDFLNGVLMETKTKFY